MLLNRNKEQTPAYDSYQLEEDFHPPADDLKGNLLKIKPYKNNDGIEAGANLLQTLHDVYIENGENKSDSHAFEVWFDKGRFKFRLYAGNPRAEERFKRRVDNVYTNSEVETVERSNALPKINEDYYVAGTWLDENRHTFVPIRHDEGSGFRQNDPYSDILGEMSSLDDSIVILQVVFRAARQDWTENGPDGRSVDEVANDLRAGHVESLWNLSAWLPWHEIEEYEATEKEKRAAKLVQEQRGEQGFHVDIRVLSASPQRREAIERARGVSRLFTNIYSGEAQQRLIAHPVEPDDMLGFLERMTYRTWIDEEMILSLDELAGVAHIPNKGIQVPQIKWKTTKSGSDVDADSDKDVGERDRPEQSPLAQEQDDVDPNSLDLNLGADDIGLDLEDKSKDAVQAGDEPEDNGLAELFGESPAEAEEAEAKAEPEAEAQEAEAGAEPEPKPEPTQDQGRDPEEQAEVEPEQDAEPEGIATESEAGKPAWAEGTDPFDTAEETTTSPGDADSGEQTHQPEPESESDTTPEDGDETPTGDSTEVEEQLMRAFQSVDGAEDMDESQLQEFASALASLDSDGDSSKGDAGEEEPTPDADTEGESESGPIEADGGPQDHDATQPEEEGASSNNEQDEERHENPDPESQDETENGEDKLPQPADEDEQESATEDESEKNDDEDISGML